MSSKKKLMLRRLVLRCFSCFWVTPVLRSVSGRTSFPRRSRSARPLRRHRAWASSWSARFSLYPAFSATPRCHITFFAEKLRPARAIINVHEDDIADSASQGRLAALHLGFERSDARDCSEPVPGIDDACGPDRLIVIKLR